MCGEFRPPDWEAPLDTADRLARIPPRAMVKGMFFHAPLELARMASGRQPGRDRYVAFQDYPLTEHVRVLAECARLAYPMASSRLALRQFGREAYRTFVESLAGRALFAIAARTWDEALRLVPRAYRMIGPVGTADLQEVTAARVVIALREIWNFPDSYHAGVFEAALEHYGKRGAVWTRVHSLADVDLEIRIESAA